MNYKILGCVIVGFIIGFTFHSYTDKKMNKFADRTPQEIYELGRQDGIKEFSMLLINKLAIK